jgi:hypothetical protein
MINVRASKIGAAAVVDAPLQVPTPNSFSGWSFMVSRCLCKFDLRSYFTGWKHLMGRSHRHFVWSDHTGGLPLPVVVNSHINISSRILPLARPSGVWVIISKALIYYPPKIIFMSTNDILSDLAINLLISRILVKQTN